MSLAIKVARAGNVRAMNGRQLGDPGLFGFLGKVAKGAIGGAVGLATGGFTGALQGAAAPFLPRPTSGLPVALATPPGMPVGPGSGGHIVPTPGFRGTAQRFLPGGASGFQTLACPSGFHPNKHDYFLRDGTFVPAGSRCVKNRRRNPLNPRALRRAVARVDSGKIWQSKLREIETSKFTKAGSRKD